MYNRVGWFWTDDSTDSTVLLTDKRMTAGAWEYTAYPVNSDEPEYKTSIVTKNGFDNWYQRSSENWRELFVGADMPYAMVASLLSSLPQDIKFAAATLCLLVEDATEATDDELTDAINAVDALYTSTYFHTSIVALAGYTKRMLTVEFNRRVEYDVEDDYSDVPFDGYLPGSRVVATARFDDYKDELLPGRVDFWSDTFEGLPIWARR